MHFQWLTTEHNRLHVVEEWPDGPMKDAALRAIRSSLESLMRIVPEHMTLPVCETCLSHRSSLIQLPIGSSQTEDARAIMAA
jgi:hypothetical protein